MYCSRCKVKAVRGAKFCTKCGTKLDGSVEYENVSIHVAGVTFKNGRKSRQAILRRIRFGDDEFSNGAHIEIKQHEYEGKPALGVYANDQQIGNIPASQVQYIIDNQFRIIGIEDFEIVGGGIAPDGEQLNYGARFIVRMRK